jgi:phenylacetic acid degradation protein paaN
MSNDLFARHRALLDLALAALAVRGGFSAYGEVAPEVDAVLAAEGREAFANYCESYFYLDQPGVGERLGEERSPFGVTLDIQYPKTNLNAILPAAERARVAWERFDLEERAGICLEVLHQLRARAHEIGLATMHTTGAPYELAYRQGAVLAQDRALEALAWTFQEIRGVPAVARSPSDSVGGHRALVRRWKVRGLGAGLVIGCSTQPNLRAYPALFASLLAGNAVVVKPHPQAVLPLAITVGVARHVLKEAGADPNLVTLVVDESAQPLAQVLAVRPEVRMIDYTGNTEFARWLDEHARHARCQLFGGAVNPVVWDASADLDGALESLVRWACEFAGRSCTAPRVLMVPRTGIGTPGGLIDIERFAERLSQEFSRQLSDPLLAARALGATRVEEFGALVEAATASGETVVESLLFEHPEYPRAWVRTPAVIRVAAEQSDVWRREWFGPILFLVEFASTGAALAAAAELAAAEGALLAVVETMVAGVRRAAEETFASRGTTLFADLAAAVATERDLPFGDFHGPAVNPAGNAVVCDAAFVARRFRVSARREWE